MRKLLVLGSVLSALVLTGAGCAADKAPAEPAQTSSPVESSPQATLPESQPTEPAPQTSAPASVTPKPSTPAPAATPAAPAPVLVTTQPETREIVIAGFAFSPASVTVKTGTTVKWTNNDSAPHSIASSDGKFTGSSVFSKGNSYQFTFDKPGTYNYICGIHPSMSGQIIVQ